MRKFVVIGMVIEADPKLKNPQAAFQDMIAETGWGGVAGVGILNHPGYPCPHDIERALGEVAKRLCVQLTAGEPT